MRSLKTPDLFTLSRILKKMDIKNEMKKMVVDGTGKTEEELALLSNEKQIEIMFLFIENIGSAEREICKFLADLTGKTLKEIESQGLNELMGMIKELFELEDIGSFFTTALK